MKHTTISRIFAAGVAAAVLSASAAFAGTSAKNPPVVEPSEPVFTGALTLGYDSKYVWRGYRIVGESDYADNLLWADLNGSAFGFNLGAWYAYSLDGDDYDELDIYGSYTYSLGPVDLTAGAIYYYFPFISGGDDDTFEVFGSIAYTGISWLTPSISYYYDLDAVEGSYLEFKLASSIPVGDKITVDPYALVSYNFEYLSDDNDFHHFQAGLSVSYAILENLTLTGYGAVSVPLDAIDDTEDTEVWGGAKLSLSF